MVPVEVFLLAYLDSLQPPAQDSAISRASSGSTAPGTGGGNTTVAFWFLLALRRAASYDSTTRIAMEGSTLSMCAKAPTPWRPARLYAVARQTYRARLEGAIRYCLASRSTSTVVNVPDAAPTFTSLWISCQRQYL